MRRPAALALLSLALGCAATATRGPSSAQSEPPLFEFHSGFWLNLHQRLHRAATAQRPSPPGTPADPDAPAWAEAVGFYQQRFGARGGMGLFFDEELISLNRRLAALGSAPAPSGVEPALAAQLGAAAALVRPGWADEDRQNRAWIAVLEPALRRHGRALAAELSAVFQARWPRAPIRVDVSRSAGPFGAYTVSGPPHITISSGSPAYAGDWALEMIFHEAAHTLIEPIEKKIAAEAARRGRPAPEDLWHAVIFYSAGELARRRLGPGYVPYATKNGLWARGWQDLEAALRRHFQPYLDGRADLDGAIAALVAALSPPG